MIQSHQNGLLQRKLNHNWYHTLFKIKRVSVYDTHISIDSTIHFTLGEKF